MVHAETAALHAEMAALKLIDEQLSDEQPVVATMAALKQSLSWLLAPVRVRAALNVMGSPPLKVTASVACDVASLHAEMAALKLMLRSQAGAASADADPVLRVPKLAAMAQPAGPASAAADPAPWERVASARPVSAASAASADAWREAQHSPSLTSKASSAIDTLRWQY